MGKQPSWSRRHTKYEKFRSRVRRFENLESRTLLDGNGFFEPLAFVVPIVGEFTPRVNLTHHFTITSVAEDTDNAYPGNQANDGLVNSNVLHLTATLQGPSAPLHTGVTIEILDATNPALPPLGSVTNATIVDGLPKIPDPDNPGELMPDYTSKVSTFPVVVTLPPGSAATQNFIFRVTRTFTSSDPNIPPPPPVSLDVVTPALTSKLTGTFVVDNQIGTLGGLNLLTAQTNSNPGFNISYTSSVPESVYVELLRDDVELLVDSKTVAAGAGTITIPVTDTSGAPAGPHSYKVRLTDAAGNTVTSAALSVTILAPPLTAPNSPQLKVPNNRPFNPFQAALEFTISGVGTGNTARLYRNTLAGDSLVSIDETSPYTQSGDAALSTQTYQYQADQYRVNPTTGTAFSPLSGEPRTFVAVDITAPKDVALTLTNPLSSELGGLVTATSTPTFNLVATDSSFKYVNNVLTYTLRKTGSTTPIYTGTGTIASGADNNAVVFSHPTTPITLAPGMNALTLEVKDSAGNALPAKQFNVFVLQTGQATSGAPGTPVYTSQYDLVPLNSGDPTLPDNQNFWTQAFDNTTQTVWFTMEHGQRIGHFDPATGTVETWKWDATTLGESADNPHGIAFDFNSHLTPRIWFVHRHAYGTLAGPEGTTPPNAPEGYHPYFGRLTYFDIAAKQFVSYDFPENSIVDPITQKPYELTDTHAVIVDTHGTVWVSSDNGNQILEFDFDEPIPGGTNLNSRNARLTVHTPPETHAFEHFHPHGLKVVVDDRTGQAYVWAISEGGSGQIELLVPRAGEAGQDLWMTWDVPNNPLKDTRGTFLEIDDNETPGNPLDDKIIGTFPVITPPEGTPATPGAATKGWLVVLDPSAQLADLSAPHQVTMDAWQIRSMPQAGGPQGTQEPYAAINQPFVDRSGEIYYIDRLAGIARLQPSELQLATSPSTPGALKPAISPITTSIDRHGELSSPIPISNPQTLSSVNEEDAEVKIYQVFKTNSITNDSTGTITDRSYFKGIDQYENVFAQGNSRGNGPFRALLNAGGVLYGSLTQDDKLSTTVFAETERRPMTALPSPTVLAAGVVQGRMAFQVKRDGSLILTARGDGELADNQTNLSDVIAGKSGSLSRSALSIDGDPSATIDKAGNVFVFGRNNSKGLVVYKYTAPSGQWTSAKLFNPANWTAFTLAGWGTTVLPSTPTAYTDANGNARALVTNNEGHLLLFRAEATGGPLDLTGTSGNIVYSSVGVVQQGNMMYAYGTNQTGGLIEYSFRADQSQPTATSTPVNVSPISGQSSIDVRVFQNVTALLVNNKREVFAVDGNAQLVNITITGTGTGVGQNVTKSVVATGKAFGYFDWQAAYGGRVYSYVDPVVYNGKLYVYGTNASDLIEFTRDAQGKWQAANLTNDVYATLGADASPTRNPSSRSPANKVFGAPTAYVQTNGERHILQINADGDVIEYYYLPGDAIAHAHTQNVNLRLQNATAFSVNENATLEVAKPGVLQNFVPAGSAALQASIITGTQHGTLTLRTDGSFTYVPNPGFSGRDGFVFKAVGSLTAADPIEVSITVMPLVASTSLSPSDQVFLASASKQMLGHALDGLNDGILTQFAVAGASRAQLANQFWLVAENRANRVSLLYQQILHRAADKSGRDYFSQDTASNPFSENAVARALLKSSEYQQSRTSNATFVDGLYRDVLGRAPDTGGLNSWTQALNQGTSRDAVIDGFLNSSERRSRVIKDLTTQIFGASTNVNGLPTSSDPTVLGKAILASPEFAKSAPLVPLTAEQRTYLDRLTKSLAGRAPTASELDLLANDLRLDSTRLSFVKDVWYFNENLVKRVDAVYRQVLKRAPNSTESSNSVNSLRNGGTEDDLAVTLLTSTEYTNANSSTSAYVDSLYKNILGRNADTAGKNSWVAALAGGQSRANVARSFLNSDERRLKIIDSLYTSLLGKTADATGRAFYLDKFKSGLTVEGVNQLFLASNDYYTKLIK